VSKCSLRLIFIIISGASRSQVRNRASTRSGFIVWCRDSPLPITVCAYSQLAAWAGIAQSAQRIATGWMVRGSNPDGDKIFRNRPDRPWGPPNLLYNGYRVYFLGLKWAGRAFNTITQSSAEVPIPSYHYSWTSITACINFCMSYRLQFHTVYILQYQPVKSGINLYELQNQLV
jgi:hypothetical protein